MTPIRIFSVLASIFLVAAVALGSVLPADEPLSQVIADLDGSWLAGVQAFELQHFGGWLWQGVTVPILVRPPWMLPLSFGIVCLGVLTSITWRQSPTRRRPNRG